MILIIVLTIILIVGVFLMYELYQMGQLEEKYRKDEAEMWAKVAELTKKDSSAVSNG